MHGKPAPSWANRLVFAWPRLGPQVKTLPDLAVYDLANQPTTYDFAAWVVIAKTLGAKRVHFSFEGQIQDWKYSATTAWRRFGNIVLPLCDLMGLPWTIGNKKAGFTVGHHFGQVNALYEELGRIEKLPHVEGPSGHVTITIRESIRNTFRDSNRPEWDKFANWLSRNGENVVVLEDGETRGSILDLQERMALYSNAKMNFGVNNGPMSLCELSEAPYIVMNMAPDCPEGKALEEHMTKGGFPPDSQFHFRNDRQKLVWKPDTCENLIREYASEVRRAA